MTCSCISYTILLLFQVQIHSTIIAAFDQMLNGCGQLHNFWHDIRATDLANCAVQLTNRVANEKWKNTAVLCRFCQVYLMHKCQGIDIAAFFTGD